MIIYFMHECFDSSYRFLVPLVDQEHEGPMDQ